MDELEKASEFQKLEQRDTKDLTALDVERAPLSKKSDTFFGIAFLAFISTAVFFFIVMRNGDKGTNNIVVDILFFVSLAVFIVCCVRCATLNSAVKRIDTQRQSIISGRLHRRKKLASAVYADKGNALSMPERPFCFRSQNLWVANRTLYFMDDEETFLERLKPDMTEEQIQQMRIDCSSVPVDCIQYYAKEGDVQYTSKISGGGGGGSSIAGAVVGGVIAGGAGAIIGSRKPTEAITTTTEVHDDRRTVIRFFDNGSIRTLTYDGFAVYDFLLKNIPDKDLLTQQLQSVASAPRQQTPVTVQIQEKAAPQPAKSVKDRLQALDDLRSSGLLSDDEYKSKRAEILKDL